MAAKSHADSAYGVLVDQEIQKSIRYLGLGFQAGRFSTRELLDILRISRVYIASGVLQGIFFSPPEVVAAKKHYRETGYLITEEHQKRIEKWAASEQPEDISLDCYEASQWFSPENKSKSDLDISIIDIQHPTTCLACRDDKSVSKLASNLNLLKCGNEVCKETSCIQHVMECFSCGKTFCLGCIASWVNDEGILVDTPGYPMCIDCLEKWKGVKDGEKGVNQ